MSLLACIFLFVLSSASPLAQTHDPAPPPEAYGFTYKLPPDWKTAPPESALPAAKQTAVQSATKPDQVLGFSCAQEVLSAQHGTPPSVIVVFALPFACYGQPMTAKNLSGFAAGVSEGLKQNFNISNPVIGSYMLGTHDVWIERAVAIPKDHPQTEYTLEVACSVLKKSAVCWMILANGAGALRDFENGLVTLDGEPPLILVPINAFAKKPL